MRSEYWLDTMHSGVPSADELVPARQCVAGPNQLCPSLPSFLTFGKIVTDHFWR